MKKAAAAVLVLCFCTAFLSTTAFGAEDILLIAPAPIAPAPIAPAPIAPAPIAPAPVQAGYTDVPDDHWAKDAIDRWTDLGVLQGNPDGTFAPDDFMTLAQFVTFLSRALKLATAEVGVLDAFEGIDKTAWYAQPLANCVGAGIMGGVFVPASDPDGFITREQAALMLCRAYGVEPMQEVTPNYIDAFEISSDAMPYVAALTAAGALKGYPDKTLKPQNRLTRAELVCLASETADRTVAQTSYIMKAVISGKGMYNSSIVVPAQSRYLTALSGITAELCYLATVNQSIINSVYQGTALQDICTRAVESFNAGAGEWEKFVLDTGDLVTGNEVLVQACISNDSIKVLEPGVTYSMFLGEYELNVTILPDEQ